ncbi:MAG TPA: DNA internalization-related competence protein ComEC/Rec2 [Candidatus Kapabacteria bacterium]|nr:DNA internalization-related competence protein ComEC/Rec2 [Candidatus Kapabacteria bacterium]
MQPRQIERHVQPRPILRNRPGLSVFLAVILGVAVAALIEIDRSIAIYFVAGALLLLPVLLVARHRLLRNAVGLLLCAAVGIAIYSHAQHDLGSATLAKFAQEGGRSKVTGVVSDFDETRRGYLVIVAVEEVIKDSIVLELEGLLAAQLNKAEEPGAPPLPAIGDTITLFAEIYPLREKRNPYATNYESRLKYHFKASAVAELNSRFDYYLRPSSERSTWLMMSSFFAHLREKCDTLLAASILDEEASAFVRAVVLGKRGEIDEATVLDFKYTGLTHLLAISGFNIAVVSLLIAQGLVLFGIRRRSIRLPITAIGVALYCFMVGLEPSVLRAMIMIELYLLALVLERKSDLANIAALTALGHIFLDPLIVHDAGFQLSYAAVFGFALIQPHLMRLFGDHGDEDVAKQRTVLEWLRHSLILSVAAYFATAPVLLYHFRQISLVVLLANLSAIPLTAAITTLGFIMIPLAAIAPGIAQLYGDGLGWMVNALLTSSEWLARSTGGGLQIDLAAWAILVLSGTLLWILQVARRRDLVKRSIIAISVAIFATLVLNPSTTSILPQGELSVVFADVGQGDATIVRTPEGRVYMFDFGPLNGSDLNFSARAYAPLMQVEGAEKIQAGFLTHLHRDHYGAVFSAAYSDKLDHIFAVGDRTSDEFAYSLDSLVRAEGIEVKHLTAGQVIELEPGVKLYVLAPDSVTKRDEISNDRSLALKLVYGSTSLLLLGDMEQAGEQQIVSSFGDQLRSNIVKVAHHGSISSSTSELVRAADADFAVISCGRGNRFGHPHRTVVSRWMRTGAEVLRTDIDGAIIFSSDGRKFSRIHWK